MTQTSVMVVEEERIAARGIRTQLQSLGYVVPAVVSYGEDAVHQAAELHPDLVLMDVQLKGEMDGIEAARRIQAESDIPVVYVTAFADPDTLRRAKSAATFGYLLKPYEDRDLQATIEMAVAKHRMDKALRDCATRLERSSAGLALINRLIEAAGRGESPRSLLRTTCRELADIFAAPYAVAVLLEEGGQTAQLVGEFLLDGQRQSLGATVKVDGTPLLQYVLARHEPWVIEDIAQDPRLSWLPRRLPRGSLFSLLVLPLVAEKEVIGGLALAVARQRGFAKEDAALGWVVATHLAIAIARVSLSEERVHLSGAIEQMAEAVAMTDLCGNIVYVNRAFEQMSGYAAADVLGRSLRLFRSDEQAEQVYEELWATVRDGNVWRGQLVNRKREGALYTADVVVTPLRDEAGKITHYISVERDITQLVTGDGEDRPSCDMESISRLAAGIAHDYNNLLTAISGNASMIAEGLVDGVEVREVAEEILTAGKQAAELTRQLLTLTRKQAPEPHVMSPNGIVQQGTGSGEAQSAEGQDTRFGAHLPHAHDAKGTRELPTLRASGEHSGETILLVEDDDSIFELTRRVLARSGYRLLVARDGLEAEEVAASYQGPIDLLLTDLTMPRMDGNTLAERLSRARPDLKVLLMSGYAGSGRSADREHIDGMAFVQKPFRPQDLVRKVRALLDQ